MTKVFIKALVVIFVVLGYGTGTAQAGQVWLNSKSGVYHCPGTRWYANTKRGRMVDEEKAIVTGYRPARGSHCSQEARRKALATINSQFNSPSASNSDTDSVQVWVNKKSRVYHCPNTRWYGKTKRGYYTTEQQAISTGNRPAYKSRCN